MQEGTDQEIRGILSISGAWALYPMVIRWAEEFNRVYPEVEFDISAGGAGKGMADVLAGAVDIGMVSRDVHPSEIEQGAFWVVVTKDAVVATMNADNPMLAILQTHGVSRNSLNKVWLGEVMTWGELAGEATASEEIHVYTRSDACGAAETWAAFLGDLRQEDLQGVAVYGDPGLAEAVVQDRLGIGYNNLNFAYDAESGLPLPGLAILPIDVDADGMLDENERFYENRESLMSAIADGRYPSPPARGLFLVTDGQPEGLARLFIQWVLTEGQAYTQETGYIPLSETQSSAELENIE
ncbi:MAG: substrate-binding domain-containing protein [Anaerolineales bacterium]|nr:substrate-binding domain-containing protein [Anaerolineales bacterium]